ncbi:hypothetical protein [Paeniglutamicibacter sp. NPDC091659]|uniref:hypothetical protein n=1 Tax=Paeniglutamicibacter sp. NPDC091659 TaxID=3364389 RepID=UPI003811D937
MSQSEPTLRAGSSVLHAPSTDAATHVPASHLSKLSFVALVACPVFAVVGLIIYGLPVLLFMVAGSGSLMAFGSCANAFTVPAVCALALGFVCLLFAAVGYFVVFFNRK